MIRIAETRVKNILTRTSGYLKTVSSHSLQPYRGCTFGNALCGVGCYVRHNGLLTRGEPWGSFLDARVNAAESYRERFGRERTWARKSRGKFSVFMSSSTDPFVPQEDRYGITGDLLLVMCELPPDELILQTHTDRVTRYLGTIHELSKACSLRVHISIETDRDRLPGLPPPATPVDRRFKAARKLRETGIKVVITVAPLLPIEHPERFFRRIADCADAVVLDHFIEGDGSADGSRTRRTPLPDAMQAVDAESTGLGYRHRMVEVASRYLAGRVGVSIAGFAGSYS